MNKGKRFWFFFSPLLFWHNAVDGSSRGQRHNPLPVKLKMGFNQLISTLNEDLLSA